MLFFVVYLVNLMLTFNLRSNVEVKKYCDACGKVKVISLLPRGYKRISMFSSADKSQITKNFLANIAEHENFFANKYENVNHC